MSLPPELRVLCFKLSSTAPSDLPRLTPTLLRHVSCCQAPLSSPAGNATQADASASSVLVHKLKTQLSTLLNGKSPEGRFAAVVLIKAVVEVGGWEILHGVESWVRGLLSILGKPDAAAVKELCVMTLTKIYSMTQQYQTLIREITTPTLPTFVTSCLNLISTPSKKVSRGPTSLEEAVFQSFAMLVPRHTAIFRPFVSQIRVAIRPFLAPTSSDTFFTSSSLRDSARRLAVILHQTAAKNTSGEEWGKAVRGLIKDIHTTADHVFRAVVEDWESSAGYIGEAVDVNQELHGGSATSEDLPLWIGIHAGVERLTGRLELLAEYLKVETAAPVAVPLGSIMDMATRMLSIAIPSPSSSAAKSEARLHPAIDRDERDGLWVGMPQIYVAALQLVDAISIRLEDNFLPLAQESFDQLAWVFKYGKHSPEFRLIAYVVTAKILFYVGQSFNQLQCDKLTGIYQACCQDLQEAHPNFIDIAAVDDAGSKPQGNYNAEAFLRSRVTVPTEHRIADPALNDAARDLLPLFLSHLPQQYLKLATRSLVDRTSILTHNKDAMLASVLNPMFANNGAALPSILPHLSREFGHDAIVEILLRPRMPLVPSTATRTIANEAVGEESEDEDMELNPESTSIPNNNTSTPTPIHQDPFAVVPQPGFGSATEIPQHTLLHHSTFGTDSSSGAIPSMNGNFLGAKESSGVSQPHYDQADDPMAQDSDDSDDESVHLTMQLDSESEDGAE
ncbi:rRNA processing/ribosome biogenesis-domain-containing protein [Leptodontidium sp. 2 PMI_412]|nr:rRNA processing/ribosome biogenesis-domain-containing protein [Leptodontidium sp. MPI-SDFR-AT-0119]KAH9220988.1 rRNA processing/ribosome biogenesis-domain-containing protein [Leptodontidium sp. 2 PMI_412]